ncbi:MAG: cytochrome-c peroxidase [Cytophagales bacterium]|nr:cytochrome-c peroxidase [Cytophagales bacterium]
MKKVSKFLVVLVLFGVGIIVGKFFLIPKPEPNVAPTFFDSSAQEEGAELSAVEGNSIEVKDGQLIQEAVSVAKSGDIILVYPGIYKETVYIDKDNIRLYGVVEEGKRPILDGSKELNDAILYSGNGIAIENFIIKNYKGNGIMGQAGNNFVIKNNWIFDAGVYGIFPQFGKNGLVELNKLSGIEDAAIYIGMCDNIDVRNNEVYESVAGIEIENSRHCLVENNYVHDNAGGLLAFITPGLPIKTCYDIILRENFVINNNHVNFGAEGSVVAGIPSGTGLLIMAADNVTVEDNFFVGNKAFGIGIVNLENGGVSFSTDEGIEQNPDNISILDNYMENNGYDPPAEIKAATTIALMDNIDVAYLADGKNNCILNRGRYLTLNLGDFADCELTTTKEVASYRLNNPVAPRDISKIEMGKLAYYGVCAGCHSYNNIIVGPSVKDIQTIYPDNPEGIVEYITNPYKKRPNLVEMPSQKYLPEDVRKAVAEYMLSLNE